VRKRLDDATVHVTIPLQSLFVRDLKAGSREGLE
jgi:flagellar biosynthesis/type III secretory pathway M-ring protein FliF/YscJ